VADGTERTEAASDAPEGAAAPAGERAPAVADEPGGAAEDPLDRGVDDDERWEREWSPRSSGGDDGDKKLEALQNTPARAQSLGEALLGEIALLELSERQRAIAEFLVYSLDDHGFLHDPLDALAAESGIAGATAEEFAVVLAQVREITHPALGARDLAESLALQLAAHGIDDPLVRELVDKHLEDITENRLPKIARATERSLEDIKDAIDAIRMLDPHPAADFGSETAAPITPEVVVERVDGRYEVRLLRERSRELRLSGLYKQYLKGTTRGDATQQWIKKRVEAARWFLEALHQRQSTLLRIAQAIFARQETFLEKGLRHLRPLRMQEVADEVRVHISTVSRAVSGKYAQTPRGIFPLKFFFSSGTTSSAGQAESQIGIKDRLRELVDREPREHPLSDEELAEELERQAGIKIARRTVTKYRKALGILPSGQRRGY
jgi:RNA polymerase sigma-54 factor